MTNMKRYIDGLLALLFVSVAFTACTQDEGSMPGGDANPNLVIFAQKTVVPNNADNDGTYRVAVNNKTTEVYYLAEPTKTVKSNGMSEASYADYVVSKGKKAILAADSLSGGSYSDVVVTGMVGDNTVSFVAVGGGQKTLRQTTFFGLVWLDVVTGTYTFNSTAQKRLGLGKTVSTTLQKLESDPTQYRLKNLFGLGVHLKFTLTKNTGSDSYDSYDYVRVPGQELPLTYGTYGAISIRDIGYWKGDDSMAFSPDYGCYMYNNAHKYEINFGVQLYVSAGSLGYGWDYFEPAQ